MKCYLLLLFCLLVSAQSHAECRSAEGVLLNSVYQKRVSSERSYLTVQLKTDTQRYRFAIMDNLSDNLASSQLFSDCGEVGGCGGHPQGRLIDLRFGSEPLSEGVRATFRQTDDNDLKLLINDKKANISGILGQPFLDAFQWQFHGNRLTVYKGCDPNYAGSEGYHFIRMDRYDLPYERFKFIGDVIYAHIVSGSRYDRNLRLTFNPDPRLYMVGKIDSEVFRGTFSQFTHLVLSQLMLGDTKRYGENELHELYLQTDEGKDFSRFSTPSQAPLIKNIEAILRPSWAGFPSHLQMSLFGLAKALKSEVLWFRIDGKGGIRLNGLKGVHLNEPESGQAIF